MLNLNENDKLWDIIFNDQTTMTEVWFITTPTKCHQNLIYVTEFVIH